MSTLLSANWVAATNLDPSEIGPGLGGFLTMFALAIAVILLVRSMVGHLRKVRYSPDPAAQPPTAQPPVVQSPSGHSATGQTATGQAATGQTATGQTATGQTLSNDERDEA